jgi:hypothetical protein
VLLLHKDAYSFSSPYCVDKLCSSPSAWLASKNGVVYSEGRVYTPELVASPQSTALHSTGNTSVKNSVTRTKSATTAHMDADLDPAFHFDADPDPTLQSDADPDPTTHFFPDLDPPKLLKDPLRLPPFHFDADPGPDPARNDADPQHFYLVQKYLS